MLEFVWKASFFYSVKFQRSVVKKENLNLVALKI